ncbi:MAG TPA: YdeI/OmpD-associated family protein [Thermoanaerobaculia bacterium]|nr:YdeI/OmpD-associated family protein [Thermoanaerobaculia bacterium]
MEPTFFATPAAFRKWLEKNHDKASELLVGFHKKDSGRPSMTWPESVDQALCFGWIDGVRRRIDDASYSIRFTPRKPISNWSAVNIARVAELTKLGLMRPAGLRAFEKRREDKSSIYSYENELRTFEPAHEKTFRANRKAWQFFNAQPPSYRRVCIYWVMSAKKEETRARRLATLIDDSANGRRIGVVTLKPVRR